MNCRHFQGNLEDYLQGDLDFAGRFGVERHAQQCFACGRILQDAQKLGDAARQVGRVRAPRGFEDAVMRRIQSARVRRRPRLLDRLGLPGWEELSWQRMAFGGSLAVLLLLTATVSYQWLVRRNSARGLEAAATPAAVADDAQGFSGAPRPVVIAPAPSQNAAVEPVRLGPGYFDSERGWVSDSVEPVEGEFIVLPAPGSPETMVRLPKSIRVRHAPPPEEYFIRHVSH